MGFLAGSLLPLSAIIATALGGSTLVLLACYVTYNVIQASWRKNDMRKRGSFPWSWLQALHMPSAMDRQAPRPPEAFNRAADPKSEK
jgi:hypothetical protein